MPALLPDAANDKPLGRALSDADALDVYGWLRIPRFAAVVLAVGSISFLWGIGLVHFDPRPVLYVLMPAFVALSVLTSVLIRRRIRPRATLYAQLIFDFLAITVGLALTGGATSPFLPMYVLVVVSAGAISADVSLVLGGMSIAAIAALAAFATGAEPMTQQEIIRVAIFAAIIAIVAFQSQFYVTRIRAKDDEILRLKDEFLFRTIHDLRSPTNIIALVFDKYDIPRFRDGMPEFEKDSGYVRNALGRMTGLIEELLRIGRGEQAAFDSKRERVDLVATIRAVADELSPAMTRRKVTFRYEPSGTFTVIGDPEKLKETFNNFIENAVKYNREGGEIRVTHRRRNGSVETSVADDGIGISEASLAKLFTPYFRGDVGKEIPGTGLGLYMTRKLVERMGGSVVVRSEKGKGATFTVSLPSA